MMWRQFSEIFASLSGWRRLVVVFAVLLLVAFISAHLLQPDIGWYGKLDDCTVVIFVSRINWNEQKLDRIYQGLTQHTRAELIVTSTVERLPALEGRYDRRLSFSALDDISVQDVDAAILIGGPGVRHHYGEASLQQFLRDLAERGRVLGSIGSAGALLSDAGIATGVELIVSRDVRDKVAEDGALPVDGRVHEEGLLITASAGSERDFLRRFVSLVQETLDDPHR